MFSASEQEIELLKRTILQELSKSVEFYWDHVVNYVRQGVIQRQHAIYHLEKGLRVALPEYRKMGRYDEGPGTAFWGERIDEANKALSAINHGESVRFRGLVV